jgi:hypothetical protein
VARPGAPAGLERAKRVLGGPGGDLHYGARAAARAQPAGRHVPGHFDDSTIAVEPHEVEREAHPEGVHGATARDEERVARRQVVEAGKAEEPRPGRPGLGETEAVREHSGGQGA